MNIIESTAEFEKWLEREVPLVRQDLTLKHAAMAQASFPFFRATFYRWLQLWPEICPEAANAPEVLGVGDLHIENFGTWRDQEGRLIWGVNDLDEAWPAAYTLDLMRLAASTYLAIEQAARSREILGEARPATPAPAQRVSATDTGGRAELLARAIFRI